MQRYKSLDGFVPTFTCWIKPHTRCVSKPSIECIGGRKAAADAVCRSKQFYGASDASECNSLMTLFFSGCFDADIKKHELEENQMRGFR